jgi:hypothetical protein
MIKGTHGLAGSKQERDLSHFRITISLKFKRAGAFILDHINSSRRPIHIPGRVSVKFFFFASSLLHAAGKTASMKFRSLTCTRVSIPEKLPHQHNSVIQQENLKNHYQATSIIMNFP